MPRAKQFDEEQVLDRAVELFWKKGFHATSMQDLVDHLGINRASLYDTFGGKKELFESALSSYRDKNQKWMEDFLNSHSSIREGVTKFLELSVDQSVSDHDCKGCLTVNSITEMIPGADEGIRFNLLENKNQFEEVLTRYLQQGIDSGELNPESDPRAITDVLFTLNTGIKVVAKVDPNRERLMATVNASLASLF